MSRFDLKARVVENLWLGDKYFRLRAHAPEIAAVARPGQFCMIRCEYSGESLLRRPFSIAAVRDHEILEFAYTTIGRGTQLLARLKPDDILLVLGPLGNSFPVVKDTHAVVVAGGIGVAPFPFLNRALNEADIFPSTFYGARSGEELIYVEELNQLSDRLVIATDDGSAGFHGFVTQALQEQLETTARSTVIYGCGPHPMLHRLKAIAEASGIPAYLSLEETMGCGIGICIGCPILTENEQTSYLLCCKDGPIFDSRMVKL